MWANEGLWSFSPHQSLLRRGVTQSKQLATPPWLRKVTNRMDRIARSKGMDSAAPLWSAKQRAAARQVALAVEEKLGAAEVGRCNADPPDPVLASRFSPWQIICLPPPPCLLLLSLLSQPVPRLYFVQETSSSLLALPPRRVPATPPSRHPACAPPRSTHC